ncbi:hypothetical protein BaRGS_00023806 [Batillaria attramentaria]|uniref:Uncharacterized protein n=1 Tax=Batillaria attramentaria TaxID=370345 RepID=A0ABD0KD58_9CAEN
MSTLCDNAFIFSMSLSRRAVQTCSAVPCHKPSGEPPPPKDPIGACLLARWHPLRLLCLGSLRQVFGKQLDGLFIDL